MSTVHLDCCRVDDDLDDDDADDENYRLEAEDNARQVALARQWDLFSQDFFTVGERVRRSGPRGLSGVVYLTGSVLGEPQVRVRLDDGTKVTLRTMGDFFRFEPVS